jgi:hypothetical protein
MAKNTHARYRYRIRGKNRKNAPTQLDTNLKAGPRAAANMLTALGGRETVVSILQESNHPKAQALIDRLSSMSYIGENFATSYSAVGLKAIDIVEIFANVQQARVFINAYMESDSVMRSLVRSAQDQPVVHERCEGTGKVIDRKTGQPTGKNCVKCGGTGYILESGSRESQQLFFELLQWRKQGGALVNIDARKQQANFFGNGVGGALPGQAPTAAGIIKRADQLMLPPPSFSQELGSNQLNSNQLDRMPEDYVDAEVVTSTEE